MVYEKVSLNIDINRLCLEVNDIVLKYPIVSVTSKYGGWSILSSDGEYTDGWGSRHPDFDLDHPSSIDLVQQQLKDRNLKSIKAYSRPTVLYNNYIKQIFEQIIELGFYPRRARLICLKADSSTTWHRDAPDWLYYTRMHIPIVTNSNVYFECEDGREHMPSDGSGYLIKVNRLHKFVNQSNFDRMHIVMDAWDSKHITKYHQYPDLDYLKKYFEGM
jgi:hypothetical protein